MNRILPSGTPEPSWPPQIPALRWSIASSATMLLANAISDFFSNLTEWLEDVSGEWWFLLVIFAIALLDSVIPIVPSETTVILGGVAAGTGSQTWCW